MLPIVAVTLCAAALTAADVAPDLQSLSTVVQQQAATIQTLQARLTALENGQQSLQTELSSVRSSSDQLLTNLTAVTAQLLAVKAHATKQVAFSAYMSQTHVHVDSSPFVFNIQVTKVGDAYDPRTGIFTAPYAGLYAFHFVIVNDNNSPFIRAALVRGNTVLGVGTVDGGPNNSYDDGSVTTVTHLGKGDQVFVRREGGSFVIYGDIICSFSGFLVDADL